MKITFVSNYINHHQIPFCNAMSEKEGVDFTFIQTEPMEEERIQMGWDPENQGLPYVKLAYTESEECSRLVMDSDVVIWGGAEDETMLKPRLETGRPIIRYSERLYKTGQWKAISPRGLMKKYQDHTKYRNKPVYLLCAGAYVPVDFHMIRSYPGKMYKWGYFPETVEYDIDALMAEKCGQGGTVEIMWAARFIDWKHPELVVELAERLAAARQNFHVTMVGGGELEPQIRQMIEDKNLQEYVTLAGYRKPEEVRALMEKADIYVVTSDRQEGWGAVVNEAMNSGCAVIADHMIGAAPYLINHGENGLMYTSGKNEELYQGVIQLLNDPALREQMGRNAYLTVTEQWNAGEAAERLVLFCRDVAEGRKPQTRWSRGPLSKAPILKERNKVPERL